MWEKINVDIKAIRVILDLENDLWGDVLVSLALICEGNVVEREELEERGEGEKQKKMLLNL